MFKKVNLIALAWVLASCTASNTPDSSRYLAAQYFSQPHALEVEKDKNSVAFEKKYDGKMFWYWEMFTVLILTDLVYKVGITITTLVFKCGPSRWRKSDVRRGEMSKAVSLV